LPALAAVVGGLTGALVLITVVALRPTDNGGAPSAWQVGLAAFLLPVACLAVLLLPLFTWRRRTPAGTGVRHLITVTITARHGGWAVRWMGMGRIPAASHAPTPVSAVDQVLATALDLQSRGTTEFTDSRKGFRLRWTRVITAPIQPAISAESQPADVAANSDLPLADES